MPPKTRSDEEYITLAQVNDLLQMQKEVFTGLLQQQQDNFKSFVQIIMDSTNARFDLLIKELQDIKTSLQFTQKDVDELKADAVKHKKEVDMREQKVVKIDESLALFAAKLDYLEGQSKRNNLIINGSSELPGETWDDTEKKIKNTFVEKLQLQRDMEVERAHRTGKSEPGRDSPRPIVVRFQKYKDKLAVLERAKNLKGTKIYINEDYTEAVKQKRRELLPKMKAARERGDIAFLRHDKLIIHPRNST